MNCKLTTQEMTTHNGYQWELGKKEVITTEGGELCSSDFFHYYSDSLLAVFLNTIHANIENPRIFRVEVGGEVLPDRGLKFGSKEMELIEELELPVITNVQKIAFGILCTLEVYTEPDFIIWANNWLDGIYRSSAAAEYVAAARAVDEAAAAYSAGKAAAEAAYYAARSAGYAAARSAGYAAARSADYAEIDLITLAKKAMTYKD